MKRSKVVYVRFATDEHRALLAKAAAEQLSVNELVVRAVAAYKSPSDRLAELELRVALLERKL